MSRTLFSIHGINTTGKWQIGFADVFRCFFVYRPIRYREYRSLPLALWRLAGELIVAIAGLSVIAVLYFKGYLQDLNLLALVLCALLLTALVIHYFNAKCLERVMAHVEKRLLRIRAGYAHPNVIGHSLGTLLVTRALGHENTVSVNNLFFFGCVVSGRFKWKHLRSQYRQVFNEMGGRDKVPVFAGLLKLNVSDIGSAGAYGFSGRRRKADVLLPADYCPGEGADKDCCARHPAPRGFEGVYNIRFKRVPHSYSDGVHHALRYWLPRLLGYDPSLHAGFLQACSDLVDAEGRGQLLYRQRRNEFLQTCFGFGRPALPGHPARLGHPDAFIQDVIDQCYPGRVPAAKLNDFKNDIVVRLSRSVVKILTELPPPTDDILELPAIDRQLWYALDPRWAMERSVLEAYWYAKLHGIF